MAPRLYRCHPIHSYVQTTHKDRFRHGVELSLYNCSAERCATRQEYATARAMQVRGPQLICSSS